MRLALWRVGAVFAVAMQLHACTTWKPEPLVPRQLLVDQRPKTVRATLHDGRRLIVTRPSIVGDSVLGAVGECRPSDSRFGSPACQTTVRPMVWVDDLQLLEVRHIDPLRSALTVGAAVAVYKLWLRWILR